MAPVLVLWAAFLGATGQHDDARGRVLEALHRQQKETCSKTVAVLRDWPVLRSDVLCAQSAHTQHR